MSQTEDNLEKVLWNQPIKELFTSLQGLTHTDFLYLSLCITILLLIVIFFIRRQPKNVTAYRTDNGNVTVSRSAIVELVQTSCQQLQDVSKPQVKVKVKGQTSHFEVKIKLMSGGTLRTIEQTLQSHLRQALTKNLGIENVGQINIVATGFKSSRIDSTINKKKDTALADEEKLRI